MVKNLFNKYYLKTIQSLSESLKDANSKLNELQNKEVEYLNLKIKYDKLKNDYNAIESQNINLLSAIDILKSDLEVKERIATDAYRKLFELKNPGLKEELAKSFSN